MAKKEAKEQKLPDWFYYTSILAAFLFTMYISIYSTLHFDSIRYMNIVVVFMFTSMVFFFLISAVYFHTEKLGYHTLAPIAYFAGMTSMIFYGYKAVDASNIVRYSIVYTIVVVGVSLFILLSAKNPGQAGLQIKTAKKISGKAPK